MPVPITEEEKKHPLYKYFERPMVAPDPQKYIDGDKPVPAELLHKPQDMNLLFDEGYLPCEFGYGQLEDGTVTLANLTQFPGSTPEMFDWWFAWHGLEPIRYKIWCHDEHHAAISRHPEKNRDTSLSMKERYWDTIHDVKEAMVADGEPQDIIIHFRNPVDIGFDPEKLKDFKGTIVCSGNEHAPMIMCHFFRPTENGCELRTRFWMGWCVKDGKPTKAIPDGVRIPPEAIKDLFFHNIKEFTNLAAILPEVYAEFKDQF
ncbi:MAG TPA: phloretin hydrolase [Papillibacter sp.]|jgi:hypothetical protein|nr:phloretin hydrolase [Papillibacter sp.]